jgi:hypothetical protein
VALQHLWKLWLAVLRVLGFGIIAVTMAMTLRPVEQYHDAAIAL